MSDLMTMLRSYAGGLVIGAVVVGGYAGVEHCRHAPKPPVIAEPPVVKGHMPTPPFEATAAASGVPDHAMDWPNTYGHLDASFGDIPPQAPDVCVQYLAMITQLQTCKDFSVDARDALLQGGRSAVSAWRDLPIPLPDDQLATLTEGCTQSVDALAQTITAECPAEIPSVQ